MARRTAFCNNKGGVGKTGVVVNTAAAAAKYLDLNVLVVDFDPQADASRRMGFEVEETEDVDTIADVIRDVHSTRAVDVKHGIAKDVLQRCRWDVPYADRLWFVPSRFDLEDTGTTVTSADAFYRLRDALHGVDTAFDLTLIDVPPTLGPLALTAWGACSHDDSNGQDGDVVVVTQPTFPGLNGAHRTLQRIYGRRDRLGVPTLDVQGVVVNQYRGTKGHKLRVNEARTLFGEERMWAQVPLRAPYSDFDDMAQPITELPDGTRDRADLIQPFVDIASKLAQRAQGGGQ